MKEYMFILRSNDDDFRNLSPEEMQKHMGEYYSWIEKITAQGNYKTGDPLESDGTIVARDSTRQLTDGPFAEAKEAIGGYFLIKANDLAEASEIAKGCPVLTMNGTVEVRPIADMTPRS